MTKVKASVKWAKISDRKLSRVVETVRGMRALAALEFLRFMPQKGARILEKVIKSAVANARHNYKLAEDDLIITEAFANKGAIMRRMEPRARGRADVRQKKSSHLTVWVGPAKEINAVKEQSSSKASKEENK